MKAIILASWKGTRLRPLTNTIPKPLIKIMWKSILEYILEWIYKQVSEIVIVVKYLKEKIIEEIWDNFKWTKITYVVQSEKKGTAAALENIDFWNSQEEILVLNWDSIFDKKDLEKIINLDSYGALVLETDTPEKYGIFKQDKDWFAKKIIEKPIEFVWNLANLWVYKFSSEILDLVKKVEISARWEYEITDAINLFLKNNKFKLIPLEWKFIDVWYPWDILEANSYFLDKLKKSQIDWKIEENVTIKWNIILEEWAILKSGTYIEWNVFIWKNTSIWPNCYVRGNSVFWENCHIWNACEIKNSCFWNNSKAWHLTYIWDSIIWNNVNFWAWFLIANLRHDNKNIKVMLKEKLVDTGRRKLGCIVWDNVKIWIWTRIYPGRILDTDSTTLPWEIIK